MDHRSHEVGNRTAFKINLLVAWKFIFVLLFFYQQKFLRNWWHHAYTLYSWLAREFWEVASTGHSKVTESSSLSTYKHSRPHPKETETLGTRMAYSLLDPTQTPFAHVALSLRRRREEDCVTSTKSVAY